jgi:GGDEF domain-containing protein
MRPDERRGAEEILHDADSAMYEAKPTGHATSRHEHKVGRRSVIDSLRARARRAIDGSW